jgi:sulfate transport system ATP-binding protein
MSIVLEAITKRFGHQLVVDRLSLDVRDGEMFVLLGASGSGKSTVLRMIAGLTAMDSGRIVLQGQDVTALPPQQRGSGFVFQNYSIFRHMTVAENIEFGLRIRGEAAATRAARREELLDLVGLTGLGQRKAHQLSGGQLQRVALARALAYHPKVLLLDEPFGALDVKIRAQVRRRMREIQRKLGVTAILVTHDQEEAFELADRIGVMERGHLLEVGPPEELYRRPRTSYVATFLGAGNILLGRARGPHAHFGHVVVPLAEDAPHDEGARVEMLMRPEDMRIAADEPSERGVLLGHGEVIEQTFAGPIRRLRLRLPRLPDTRQIAPRVQFGEAGMLLDVVQRTELPVQPGKVFVWCEKWLVLRQASPRIAACSTAHDGETARGVARVLTERMHATLSLVGVAPDADGAEALTAALRKAGPTTAVRVRQGDPTEQIVMEQQESLYDLVVVEAGFDGRGHFGVSDQTRSIVESIDGAVLVVREGIERVERILVATAAGEPGKVNVRIGAWLARRLNARVTLLYVAPPDHEVSVYVRAHLERAESSIRALDVPVDVLIARAPAPAIGIVEAAASHDLVIIGGHGPESRVEDVTIQVLEQATRPVMVVAWEPE